MRAFVTVRACVRAFVTVTGRAHMSIVQPVLAAVEGHTACWWAGTADGGGGGPEALLTHL